MLLAINCICSKDLHSEDATHSRTCMREISILLFIRYIYSNGYMYCSFRKKNSNIVTFSVEGWQNDTKNTKMFLLRSRSSKKKKKKGKEKKKKTPWLSWWPRSLHIREYVCITYKFLQFPEKERERERERESSYLAPRFPLVRISYFFKNFSQGVS